MSTIACPRCASVFPLEQVAQFDQFTCGACGTVVPVPIAKPAPLPPQAPSRPAPAPATMALPPSALRAQHARPSAPAPTPLPPGAPRPAARPAPSPAAPARPAAAPQRAATAPAPARAAAPAPARAAAPAPVRRAPPPPPPVVEEDAYEEPAETSGRGRGARDDEEPAEKKSQMPLILAGVGVVVVLGVVIAAMSGGSSGDPEAAKTPAAVQTPAAAQAAADPDKDPAAWKALPESDRKMRAQMKVASLDPKQDAAAKAAFDFLMARDEKETALEVARQVAKARTEIEWPHVALGHENLRELYEKCVAECQYSDGFSTDPMQELQQLEKTQAPARGAWWGDDATQQRVKELIAKIREEEKTLSTPFGQGVAKWVNYHRSIDVMRDFPALHATVGPYLVFVSLPAASEPGKDVSLRDVKPEDVARGQKLLDDTTKLFGAFYDGWHEQLAPIFGFTKYGPENTTQDTTLLVNVFTSEADYRRYNAATGGPGGGTRAYYSPSGVRFITTYDGPPSSEVAKELGENTAQVQCHEGTHQLVHFYQWDLLRKANGGKALDWTLCGRRPMWLEEGWAEFFASFKVEGDKYVFMQPLDDRMCDVWSIGELLKLKKWEDWRMREILEPFHNGQLEQYGKSRTRMAGDEGLAINAMANLFYGKAWSLNYFLWNFQEGGKLKYRDRFIALMKYAYTPRIVTDPQSQRQFATSLVPNDFKKYFELTDEAKMKAFETEWRDWEAKFLAEHKTADWDRRKKILFEKIWGLNPDGTRRPAEKHPEKKPDK